MVSWFVLILSSVVLLNAFVTQSFSDSSKSSKNQKMLAENLIQHYALLSLTYTAEIWNNDSNTSLQHEEFNVYSSKKVNSATGQMSTAAPRAQRSTKLANHTQTGQGYVAIS